MPSQKNNDGTLEIPPVSHTALENNTESNIDYFWYIQDTMSEPEKELLQLNDNGKFEVLFEKCSKILEKNPKDTLGLGYITDALIGLEKYEEANEYCNQFLEIDSSNSAIGTNKAIALDAMFRIR